MGETATIASVDSGDGENAQSGNMWEDASEDTVDADETTSEWEVDEGLVTQPNGYCACAQTFLWLQ